jgi:hypothetical protein
MYENGLLQFQENEYITSKELSMLLNIHTATLATWRYRKIGPDYIKHGDINGKGTVRYDIKAINEWLKKCEQKTS